MDRPFLIQGHRGARGLQPENTLPSFEAALDAGAKSLEADVHFTADGVPVLIHDPILPGLAIPVLKATIEQVHDIIVDGTTDPLGFPYQSPEPTPLVRLLDNRRRSYRIPSLTDLFTLVRLYAKSDIKTEAQRANGATAIIDLDIKRVPYRAAALKQPAGAIERDLLNVVRAAGVVGRTWIRSFDHRCVRLLRKLEPRLTGVVLIEGTAPVDPVSVVRAADSQVYAPDYLYLDEEQVRQCHAAGVCVMPWTVNDPDDWKRLISWGVDGITTDYPDRLAAHVRGT